MQKIRSGDEVIVIAGKDKGRTGKVLSVSHDKQSAIVEGIQLVKKHKKANPQLSQEGGIIEKEAKIHISNIAILNPKTKKADRVGVRVMQDDGGKVKRVRFYKSTKEEIKTEVK